MNQNEQEPIFNKLNFNLQFKKLNWASEKIKHNKFKHFYSSNYNLSIIKIVSTFPERPNNLKC